MLCLAVILGLFQVVTECGMPGAVGVVIREVNSCVDMAGFLLFGRAASSPFPQDDADLGVS